MRTGIADLSAAGRRGSGAVKAVCGDAISMGGCWRYDWDHVLSAAEIKSGEDVWSGGFMDQIESFRFLEKKTIVVLLFTIFLIFSDNRQSVQSCEKQSLLVLVCKHNLPGVYCTYCN